MFDLFLAGLNWMLVAVFFLSLKALRKSLLSPSHKARRSAGAAVTRRFLMKMASDSYHIFLSPALDKQRVTL